MEAGLDFGVEDLGKAAEFAFDRFGLADQRGEDAVFRTLCVMEVVAENFRCGLKLPVDAAVALFETAGVPRDIEVEEMLAVGLEIEPFACGIGGEQDADGMRGRIGVEGGLDGLAFVHGSGTVEDLDALVRAIGALDGGLELVAQIAEGGFVFGENDDAGG